MRYWVMKSAPSVFSIDDLARRPKRTEAWTGVRNYQARNFMRDGMKVGDRAYFYHSSCEEPRIAGIVEVAREAYPDATQFDREGEYYDPKATREKPRWLNVDVRLVQKTRLLPIAEMRRHRGLAGMQVLAKATGFVCVPPQSIMTKYRLAYGAGALILGCVSLTFGEFALPWSPATDNESLRAVLARGSGGLLAVAGAATLLGRSSSGGILVLASFYALCLPLVHAARILARPTDVAVWLGFSETLALATAGFVGWLLRDAGSPRGMRAAQVVFGACLMQFGLSHFVYAEATARMVPAWLSFQLFWAYATGCAHVAAGLGLIWGVAARLAMTLLAAMFAGFVILVHVPRVAMSPASRREWVILGISLSLTGAAWIIRTATEQASSCSRSP